MKIGDEVYVHGYVDEIRNDVVIIRNEGGYFGTVAEEVLLSGIERVADTPQTERPSCESCKWDSEEWYDTHCDSCVAHTDKPSNYEPKAEIPKNALRSDCMGCRFVGTYDTEFPCANCTRKNKDYYDADLPQK